MPQVIDPDLKELLLSQTFRPALTLWNRDGRQSTTNQQTWIPRAAVGATISPNSTATKRGSDMRGLPSTG